MRFRSIRHLALMALIIAVIFSCSQKSGLNSLFTRIDPDHSALHFQNTISENEVLNVLDYEYIYNGGGVGIADFNGDGLPDLFFSGNMVSSRLYMNHGNLTFEDVTEAAGVLTNDWCTGVSIVDINSDGKPDIHLSTAHDQELKPAKNRFYLNTTETKDAVRFEEVAATMKIADSSYSIQGVWLDYDKDNDLDLFLANNSKEAYPKNNPYGQRSDGRGKSTDKLYRNEGLGDDGLPIFKDVSMEAGISIEGWSLGVMVLDMNGDQLPDIYVANDFMSNDLLYLNQGDGTFRNAITDYLKHQSHNSMGIDIADIDNDTDLDLLVLDMLPDDNLRQKTMFGTIPFERFNQSLARGYQPQYVRNVLQVDQGGGNFADIGHYSGLAATDWSWSPLIADFNNDRSKEVYITNGYKKDITDMDFVSYTNEASVFGDDQERRRKLVEQLQKMAGVKKSNFYFKNLGDNRFADDTKEAGLYHPSYSNGAAYGDLDRDGDLDLVVNNIDDPVMLFENRTNLLASDNEHYIRIRMPNDQSGLGAKVWVYAEDLGQYAEFHPQRGYLSSVEPILHFGLGGSVTVDSIHIHWPNDKVSRSYQVKADQEITMRPSDESTRPLAARDTETETRPLFENVTTHRLLGHLQKESSFDDFKKWPLHFRSYSRPGPVLASGDVNGDGLEDVFIGGSSKVPGVIHRQTPQGNFEEFPLGDSLSIMAEDAGAALFDADNDGDLDLYCARGSSEHYASPKRYQDGFYRNDGKGHYTLEEQAVPFMETATGSITVFDYDKDGDADLFVGGRIDPNNYPLPPRSYLLRNDGDRFVDVTDKSAPDLLRPGMVTDAMAIDLDRNGWDDLVIVGEWMPIQVFYNKEGVLKPLTNTNGLEQSHGWWQGIGASDFDGDGDIDFIAGNWGLNNPFTASKEHPVSIHAKDYDKNGTLDPIVTHVNTEREFILHPRSTLLGQLPGLNNRIPDFHTFGNQAYQDVFTNEEREGTFTAKAYELASVFVENLGDGQFTYRSLPWQFQTFPLFDFILDDLNKDGTTDILAVGNFHGTEILTGWYDAGYGLCFFGDGNGNFEHVPVDLSGFQVPGEARTLLELQRKDGSNLFLVGLQNDSLQVFRQITQPIKTGPIP